MALNGKVVNGVVVDGADISFYTQALTIASTATTSIANLASHLKTLITTAATSVASIVASKLKYLTLPTMTLTATVGLVKLVGKNIVTTVESSLVLLAEKVSHFISLVITTTSIAKVYKQMNSLLAATSTSIVFITKAVNKLLTTASSNIFSFIKQVNKNIQAAQANIATLLKFKLLYYTLTTITTSVVSISNFINKYLNYISTSVVTTQHSITKTITIVSNILFQLILSTIPKYGAELSRTLSVVKDRLLSKVSIRNIFSGKN